MNIEALGNLGEFLSSIGVIATLMFLIVEIRRNTAASKETTDQRAFERFSGLRKLLAANPQLAELLARMNTGKEFSAAERYHLNSYLMENAYCLSPVRGTNG